MSNSLSADDRGVMIPVAQVMTLAITTILIIALLIGATGMLTDQRNSATAQELRTVGNRLAADIAKIDSLAANGGVANVTTRHTDEIAGYPYTVELEHENPPGPDGVCDTNRIDATTCLVVSATNSGVTQHVPVRNESEIHLRSGDEGVFHLSAVPQASTTSALTWDRIDLSSRIGIGQGVQQRGRSIGSTPGNRPPVPKFTFRPGSPQAGQSVQFDAGRSRDPDGSIVDYQWDFDGDGNYENNSPTPTFDTSLLAGPRDVSLKVVDNEGATTTFTKFVDVSGLVYNQDMNTFAGTDNVEFTVTNQFNRDIEITHISIDPRDNTIDGIGYRDNAIEIEPDSGSIGDLDEGMDFADGGRIKALDDSATLDAGETATVRIHGFSEPVDGKWLDVGLQYNYGSTPNSTRFSDVPGGPAITNYRVEASGTNVDLQFESSDPLDVVSIEIGGAVSESIDRSDLTESPIGNSYVYQYNISDGTNGFFWANMTVAESGGVPSGEVPLNDSVITTSSGLTWSSAADWDNYDSAEGIVHDDFGDHQADQLELGYPAFDRGGNALVGYWPLDTDGSAPDVSGSGNDGNVEGGPGTTSGLFGADAYNFDGNDDHVLIPDSFSLEMADDDEVTVSTWVNIEDHQGDWIGIFQHSDISYNLHLNDNRPVFTIHDGTWYGANTGTSLSEDQWYHLVGVFDGDNTEIYVDGGLGASIPNPNSIDSTNEDAAIGANIDTGNRNFEGQIDEVRVYDRALSPGEIQRLYDTRSQGTLTTGSKTGALIAGSDVELQYKADIAGGQGVIVTVHTPNGTSDPVTISDGIGRVDVSGLSGTASEYWLDVKLTSPSLTSAPSVDTLQVVDGS